MHIKYNHFLLNMWSRGLNKFAHNPLTSGSKLPKQEMNITNDYNGKISRNSKYPMG